MNYTDQNISRAMELLEADAKQRQEDAGYAGEYGDRGAGQTRELLRAYQAGRGGHIPTFLEPFLKKAVNESNPDYLQYLRLRRQFEEPSP